MKVLILLVAIAVVAASFELEDFVETEGDLIAKRAYDDLMEFSKRARGNKGKPYCKFAWVSICFL